VSETVRLECLEQYRALVRVGGGGENLAAVLREQFCPKQSDEAERRLMEKFADGIAWLRTMAPRPLAAIQSVLEHIIDGQMLDIRRFPSDGKLRRLANDAELDEYTWLVAGCVGEFWTQLCASELPSSLDPAVTTEQMQAWGARMGKGLQLINILRDIGEDTRDGRCYLPCEPEQLQAEWRRWLQTCIEHLEGGLRYVKHVSHGKLRYATALPLLLGIQTVAKMRSTAWEQLLQGVKISRLDVASILAQAMMNRALGYQSLVIECHLVAALKEVNVAIQNAASLRGEEAHAGGVASAARLRPAPNTATSPPPQSASRARASSPRAAPRSWAAAGSRRRPL
jgi:farnesyl-diphosphate farnesyltransferase